MLGQLVGLVLIVVVSDGDRWFPVVGKLPRVDDVVVSGAVELGPVLAWPDRPSCLASSPVPGGPTESLTPGLQLVDEHRLGEDRCPRPAEQFGDDHQADQDADSFPAADPGAHRLIGIGTERAMSHRKPVAVVDELPASSLSLTQRRLSGPRSGPP
jgi:hypothetical protein